MKHLANILNLFWNCWRSKYLNELREANSYTARRQLKSKHSIVSVEDVVVVHDERLHRSLSAMKGWDGFVREATVRIGNKNGKKVLLNWLIQLLYPLEAQSEEYKGDKNPKNANEPEDVSQDTGTLTPDDEPAELRTPEQIIVWSYVPYWVFLFTWFLVILGPALTMFGQWGSVLWIY